MAGRDIPPNGDAGPNTLSLEFADAVWTAYRRDPRSVPEGWRSWLERLGDGDARGDDDGAGAPTGDEAARIASLQDRVDQLVRAYRVRGHMVARLDPLGRERPRPPELDPEAYGLREADLDRTFSARTIQGPARRTLREIIDCLTTTYCRFIGAQFMHIDDAEIKGWLQDRMEACGNRLPLTHAEQVRIFSRLSDAVVFESFVQKKFVGAKTFSLEGAESLIPLLDLAIEGAADDGVREIVLGMTHRGRLAVLANVLGKSPQAIFRELEDEAPELGLGRGDVRYHLGYSTDWRTASGRSVHLSLCFNPSHLELIDPVALGRLRAKQDRAGDDGRAHGMAILIHGDAAFIGEGVVAETLNLSELPAFTTGGTLHVIVNNQLGFTTPPEQGRSTQYASDVAKMLQIPIFHVNGEDPESVAQVTRLALDFRHRFGRDVVIDMYCYRRRGHNETDEPSFTQPLLYQQIEERESVMEGYLERLLALGSVSEEEAAQIAERRREHLESELAAARGDRLKLPVEQFGGIWTGYLGGREKHVPEVNTGVDAARLAGLLEAMTHPPEGFTPHPKMPRLMKRRRAMARGERALDWSAAEALAIVSLAAEGLRVRLCGQDSERGTFSQRHGVLHDHRTGERWEPMRHAADGQAPVDLVNSPLSELAVLGFEYGYSLDCPDGLVMWEAQFGDFVNAAQAIIDQFIVSAEDKWSRLSGITLLLPHGFEGQGPEHSSARLERFLLLAAEDNIQVAQPSTPAQYFHLLRRQVVRPWRKPLVVLTPKSMLRHPRAVSPLEDLAQGRFRRVLPEKREENGLARTIKRVLLCTGKVYWDLLARREELERDDVAIVRIEQLYPLPDRFLAAALAPYPDGTPAFWVQEEPRNMGAWSHLRARFGARLLGRLPLRLVSRPPSASPATGSHASHRLEQERLLATAFGDA